MHPTGKPHEFDLAGSVTPVHLLSNPGGPVLVTIEGHDYVVTFDCPTALQACMDMLGVPRILYSISLINNGVGFVDVIAASGLRIAHNLRRGERESEKLCWTEICKPERAAALMDAHGN